MEKKENLKGLIKPSNSIDPFVRKTESLACARLFLAKSSKEKKSCSAAQNFFGHG